MSSHTVYASEVYLARGTPVQCVTLRGSCDKLISCTYPTGTIPVEVGLLLLPTMAT
jgi:hypothetical protein